MTVTNQNHHQTMEESIINAYLNDGYVYCISTLDPTRVKIGKTSKDEDALLRRYATYYGMEHTTIYAFVRVGNRHAAETFVLETLGAFRHSHELFNVPQEEMHHVHAAFRSAQERFPPWDDIVKSIPSIDEQINIQSTVNRTIRALDLDKWKKQAKRRCVTLQQIMNVS